MIRVPTEEKPIMRAKEHLATSALNSPDRKKNFSNPVASKQETDYSDFMELVKAAQQTPDVKSADDLPPVEVLKQEALAAASPNVHHLKSKLGQAFEPASSPVAQSPSTPDAMSLQATDADDDFNNSFMRKGRPKTKSEKSYSLEPDMHKYLERVARTEGIRLDRRVSASEILRSFVFLGINFVENDEVIPTEDNRGLHPHKFKKAAE